MCTVSHMSLSDKGKTGHILEYITQVVHEIYKSKVIAKYWHYSVINTNTCTTSTSQVNIY